MNKDTVSTAVETENVENINTQLADNQPSVDPQDVETKTEESQSEQPAENPVDWEKRAAVLEKEKRDIMELLEIFTGSEDEPEEKIDETKETLIEQEKEPVIEKDKTEKGIEKLEARYQQIEFEEAKLFINQNLSKVQQTNQFSKEELGKVVQIMTEFPVKDEASALKAIQTAAKIVKADRIEADSTKKLLEEKDKSGMKPSGKKLSWNDRWSNLENEA